jgi:tRNA-Thr(GGU) m(6)t(6)A37 methyltransferase TsaA
MNENDDRTRVLTPVGYIESALKVRHGAPRQGDEGAPDAWVTIADEYLDALDGLMAGQDVILITWLHQADRDVRKVRPRDNPDAPMTGVFATRAPDRPNPLGLHRVTILEVNGGRLHVTPLEAIDGTPVLDVKPVWPPSDP